MIVGYSEGYIFPKMGNLITCESDLLLCRRSHNFSLLYVISSFYFFLNWTAVVCIPVMQRTEVRLKSVK
jgi:hypothetical protein